MLDAGKKAADAFPVKTLGDKATELSMAVAEESKAMTTKTSEALAKIKAEILKTASTPNGEGKSPNWRYDVWFNAPWMEGVNKDQIKKALEDEKISAQRDCNCEGSSPGCSCHGATRWRCSWGPKRGTTETSGISFHTWSQ